MREDEKPAGLADSLAPLPDDFQNADAAAVAENEAVNQPEPVPKDAPPLPEPRSKVAEKARERLDDDPYDVAAWQTLLKDLAAENNVEEQRIVYENVVRRFPLSGMFWHQYLELELFYGDRSKLDKLFQRCLSLVPYIPIYKMYIDHIEATRGAGLEAQGRQEVMTRAYEFAVRHVGLDINSDVIWRGYLEFVQSWDTQGGDQYLEGTRMDATRKIYQRVITLPINSVEDFWREYDAFENKLNKLTAKKILTERSAAYMTARTAFRERKTLTDAIDTERPARPAIGSKQEVKQVKAWQALIAWSKTNPLRLDDEVSANELTRYIYRQASLSLCYTPEVWIDYAHYLLSLKKADLCQETYKRGMEIMPGNSLLCLSYIAWEETRKNYDLCRETFESLLKSPECEQRSLVYIQYMAFARRNAGGDPEPPRKIFARARKEPNGCAWQVWAYAALMEYYCNKKAKTAGNIFELGLTRYFAKEIGFCLVYLDHQIHLNDDSNTRSLFERLLAGFESGDSSEESSNTDVRPIWNLYYEFESRWGSLERLEEIERRRREAFGDENEISAEQMKGTVKQRDKQLQQRTRRQFEEDQKTRALQLMERLSFMGLYPLNGEEAKTLGLNLDSAGQSFGGMGGGSADLMSTLIESRETETMDGNANGAGSSNEQVRAKHKTIAELREQIGDLVPDLLQMVAFVPKAAVDPMEPFTNMGTHHRVDMVPGKLLQVLGRIPPAPCFPYGVSALNTDAIIISVTKQDLENVELKGLTAHQKAFMNSGVPSGARKRRFGDDPHADSKRRAQGR
eukprot:Clim_evm9s244 gene=Clim_evmTU9s244